MGKIAKKKNADLIHTAAEVRIHANPELLAWPNPSFLNTSCFADRSEFSVDLVLLKHRMTILLHIRIVPTDWLAESNWFVFLWRLHKQTFNDFGWHSIFN